MPTWVVHIFLFTPVYIVFSCVLFSLPLWSFFPALSLILEPCVCSDGNTIHFRLECCLFFHSSHLFRKLLMSCRASSQTSEKKEKKEAKEWWTIFVLWVAYSTIGTICFEVHIVWNNAALCRRRNNTDFATYVIVGSNSVSLCHLPIRWVHFEPQIDVDSFRYTLTIVVRCFFGLLFMPWIHPQKTPQLYWTDRNTFYATLPPLPSPPPPLSLFFNPD